MRYIFLIMVLTYAAAPEMIDDWTKHCNKCSCIWVNGKKTANCTNKDFYKVPNDLSKEIKEIDFSLNPFGELRYQEIATANLKDIQKLKFQNCSIGKVDVNAFAGLGLIIELDLSRNDITELKSGLFKEAFRLRIINLSYNKVKKLEDGLFYNLTFLQRIILKNNIIESFTEETFNNLPALMHIDFAYNQLKTISFDPTDHLPKLNSLDLQGNPWVCDCHLEKFRQIAIKKSLITTHTECSEPLLSKGHQWMDPISFACSPVIIEPTASAHVQATEENVTLVCKVTGDPEPDVDWTSNGRTLDFDPRKSNQNQKYITKKERIGEFKWNNLTIIGVNYRDRGEYKCIAKNPGGEDAKNLSLTIAPNARPGGGLANGIAASTLWIIGLSIGLIVLLLIILILVCCFCKKNRNDPNAKRRDLNDSSEEYLNVRTMQEIKANLITDINPVTKPPRSGVPSSVVSGGTEVSDVKRNLLDSDSVFDDNDENRSIDYDQPLIQKTRLPLDMEFSRLNQGYPPDLLPYPPRAGQASPAGSNASTVADTTRLPPHHGPQSPLHSPIYDQMNIYRTLPYNRSHSPFVGQPIQRVSRQGAAGYMTIPRRPRQSWSSEPPPRHEDDVMDPVYDNLGVRSTAAGSIRSLCDTAASTPRSNRNFPLSPTSIAPITEAQEVTPPTAQVATPVGPVATPQWAEPERKEKKIPPRPPPKPKKRIASGPVFEDEGEDGTEV